MSPSKKYLPLSLSSLSFFILLLFCFGFVHFSLAQNAYPFESAKAITYKESKNWKQIDKIKGEDIQTHYTNTLPGFYNNGDTLTVQLSYYGEKGSVIRVFRNKQQIQKFSEEMFFTELNVFAEPMRVADIDNNQFSDIKITAAYMGCGLAAMNNRIIYLFQTADGKFSKVSYMDKLEKDRPERDLDNDGDYEIITMTLNSHQTHNYWTFNIYNFEEGKFQNTNNRYGYPLMVQYLYRENYKVTDKISLEKMKDYSEPLPEHYQQN